MSRRFYRDGIGTWRIEFIQPAIPGSDLFGLEGEIVGPMTMQLAEEWIDHFNDDRICTMPLGGIIASQGQ